MGFKPSLAIGVVCSMLGAAATAHAQYGPVLVIPGKPGVPVIINGYDASYTIVEGDWGLARPGQVTPDIVAGPLITPAPYHTGPYFPYQGRRPGYGRREIEPPPDRRLPSPAQSYHRQWGIESQPLPADVDPPAYPPPVISASPMVEGWDRRWRRDHHDRPRPRHHPRPRLPRRH
ncbi:MAG: hypothetical protein GEU95_10485 [Rhizobiales bacterium]|nr:hypothetical protein [Hyphomicrobiales bacterium]